MNALLRIRITRYLSVSLLIALAGPPSQAAEFAGGTGTSDDPYQIATAEHLCAIGADPNLLDKHYVLVNDLDLDPNRPDRCIFDRAVIAPDMRDKGASKPMDFTGAFDGGHHTISNLAIRAEKGAWLGLFGRIGAHGVVCDLSVRNVSIRGQARIGGLVGLNAGEIVDCHSSGHITGREVLGGLVGLTGGRILQCHSTAEIAGGEESVDLGGLAGIMEDGVIRHCHATGDISAGRESYSLGGLIGSMEVLDGEVSRCHATGNVSSGPESSRIGGLVGSADAKIRLCYASGAVSAGKDSEGLGGLAGFFSQGILTDCYSTSDVTGEDSTWRIGGLLGWADMSGTITNCYAVGRLTNAGADEDLGGLIAKTDDPNFITITGCFWDVEASGTPTSAAGRGLTTAQMQDIQTYRQAGWDMAGDRTDGTADIWQMPQGGGYPQLTVFSKDRPPRVLAGSGTSQDPYRIARVEDLSTIDEHQPACFKLVADIDLSGITWANAPIPEFIGCFDGNGHRIMNLTIRSERPKNLGLFGSIEDGAQVRNLGVEHVSIVGGNGVRNLGGLAGRNAGHVANCYATGSVSGGYDCRSVGILLGSNFCGIVRNCYAVGAVSAGRESGTVAALAGYNYMGTFTHCYACAQIRAGEGSKSVGALVGWKSDASDVNRSFWNAETGGPTEGGGGTGLTTAQMRSRQTFLDAGWDFVGERENGVADVWQMSAQDGCPILAIFAQDYRPHTLNGTGTRQDPYRIATAEDLAAVNDHGRTAHYRLTDDVDLSGITWTQAPISTFAGTFDGAGFTISHLTIRGGNCLGLFEALRSRARILNLMVRDVRIAGVDGAWYLGTLVGANDGTVIDCHATGRVSAGRKSRAVGGLIGENEQGKLIRCSTACNVSAGQNTHHIGGLVGFTLSGEITACCATGDVSGAEKNRCVGGLIGEVHYWTAVANCYATGRISAASESKGIGGLVGVVSEGDTSPTSGKLAHCYAAATVEAPGGSSNIGGLLGIEAEYEPLTQDCYFLLPPDREDLDNGNGTPLTESQMRDQASFPGWDFDTIWTLQEGQDAPRLRWETK